MPEQTTAQVGAPEIESTAYVRDAELVEDTKALVFDKISVKLLHIIEKVEEDVLYGKDGDAKKYASGLLDKYRGYADKDKEYRIKSEQSDQKRKTAYKLAGKKDKPSQEKAEAYWDEYHKMKQEMADCYIEPVDINRLAEDFIIYNASRERNEEQVKTDAALEERDKLLRRKKKEEKAELDQDLAEFDAFSANNIKSWFARVGAFGGVGGVGYGLAEAVKDVEIWGHKLGDLSAWAVGAAFLALPALQYYLEKKKSARKISYDKTLDKMEEKASADRRALGLELTKRKGKITDEAYTEMRDIYQLCFNTLDGFPENPVDAYNKRAEAAGSEAHLPMYAVEALSTQDIKAAADKMSKEADEVLK